MLRIELERVLELLERAIGLAHVVVAHAKVGARVGIVRIDLYRPLVPLNRVWPPLRIEVRVGELDKGVLVLWIALDDRRERLDLSLIERRRRVRARRGSCRRRR